MICFAKSGKQKAKKMRNPQDLIEKLAKDIEKLKEQVGEANSDVLTRISYYACLPVTFVATFASLLLVSARLQYWQP